MKNKKLFIFLGAIIIVAIVGSYFLFPKNTEKIVQPVSVDSEVKEVDEEKELLNSNSQAVAATGQKAILPVKPVDKDDHNWGKIDGKIQFIVYCDFTDVFCANFSEVLEKLKIEYPNDLAMAYRHYLASDSLSLPMAEISECAGEQGKFWEMYNELVVLRKENKLALLNKEEIAKKIDLNFTKLTSCLDEQKFKDKIIAESARAVEEGAMGVPTIFVNGQILPGAYPFEDFTDSSGTQRTGLKTIIDSYLIK